MGLDLSYDYGQTPLSREGMEGLIPRHITTQEELNEWESANIRVGRKWALGRKHTHFLTIHFILKLHKQMFSETWAWAGAYRTSGTNIGVEPFKINTRLQMLLDDVDYWLVHNTYEIDEIGARLHGKLAWIHPFNNGNGRHARLFTDVFMRQNGKEPFSWGSNLNSPPQEIRRQYIDALRAADHKDLKPLLAFVRS